MAAKMMKAVQYNGYGGGAESLKHVEVPVPTPKKGELLVKLEATSLNPIDWKIQKGVIRPIIPSKFPCIPASDVAGEVVNVGPGVQGFQPGDKIVSMLNNRFDHTLFLVLHITCCLLHVYGFPKLLAHSAQYFSVALFICFLSIFPIIGSSLFIYFSKSQIEEVQSAEREGADMRWLVADCNCFAASVNVPAA